jgi:hypothetical protein
MLYIMSLADHLVDHLVDHLADHLADQVLVSAGTEPRHDAQGAWMVSTGPEPGHVHVCLDGK